VTPPAFSSTGIRFEKIEKRYGGLWALGRVSLEIAEGECVALAGRNGSGKNHFTANRGQPGAPFSRKYMVFLSGQNGENALSPSFYPHFLALVARCKLGVLVSAGAVT
jgi:ABC-type transporter Mla maintaining outer membrane lipid asymmetry ATPase subunit MlaF